MYEKAFYIVEPVSNNAFSFSEREEPRLRIAGLKEGSLEDVEAGSEVVFEDMDEGELRSCVGLSSFIKTLLGGVPTYIFDNHNHAFAFWCEAKPAGRPDAATVLVHVDQHKDTRDPDTYLSAEDARDMDKVFRYTNTVLNVGNFVPAGLKAGLFSEIINIDSEKSIDEFNFENLRDRHTILDIDLDFFAPDLDYIPSEKKITLIREIAKNADLITIATSPFFIDQKRAIEYLKRIFA
ncbi:UPF0489 family protein [Pseudomonadota bacterium]